MRQRAILQQLLFDTAHCHGDRFNTHSACRLPQFLQRQAVMSLTQTQGNIPTPSTATMAEFFSGFALIRTGFKWSGSALRYLLFKSAAFHFALATRLAK
ncbi:MAG: hypothetical protein ACOYOU_01205 [Kiritimatiellia bacterium]